MRPVQQDPRVSRETLERLDPWELQEIWDLVVSLDLEAVQDPSDHLACQEVRALLDLREIREAWDPQEPLDRLEL